MVEVYYDGRCGMCRAGARRLRRLDWCRRLRIIDYHELPTANRPVGPEVFERGIPVRTTDGRVLVGYDGLRHAFLRVPAGWLVGWLLYVPGFSAIGRRIYRAMAGGRHGDHCARDEH